jgi:hypothetical protein
MRYNITRDENALKRENFNLEQDLAMYREAAGF